MLPETAKAPREGLNWSLVRVLEMNGLYSAIAIDKSAIEDRVPNQETATAQ